MGTEAVNGNNGAINPFFQGNKITVDTTVDDVKQYYELAQKAREEKETYIGGLDTDSKTYTEEEKEAMYNQAQEYAKAAQEAQEKYEAEAQELDDIAGIDITDGIDDEEIKQYQLAAQSYSSDDEDEDIAYYLNNNINTSKKESAGAMAATNFFNFFKDNNDGEESDGFSIDLDDFDE